MLTWLRRIAATRSMGPDSPLRQSRELTTEARLRVARTAQLFERDDNRRSYDLDQILADTPPPWRDERPSP